MKNLSIFILFCLTLGLWGEHGEARLNVNGYYKTFFTVFSLPDSDRAAGLVNNQLRLQLSWQTSEWMEIYLAYDLIPRVQSPILSEGGMMFQGAPLGDYRVEDFSDKIYPDSAPFSFGLYHNLDRSMVTLKLSWADVYIGRQAISWGSSRTINPTDIIAPFTFNTLDQEERRGVDAIRVRVPVGMMGEVDLGYIGGDGFTWDKSAAFLKGKFYWLQTDLMFLLLKFQENWLLGFDMTRSIGGAGFWWETAVVIPPQETSYVRTTIGMDYNFNAKTYGFFEFHFNSAGHQLPADLMDIYAGTAYTQGAVYLMGKYYLVLGNTYQITPLTPMSTMILWNLGDGSLSLSPSIEYNVAENIYLALGAYLGIGKSMDIIETYPETYHIHTEFGAYPTLFYTSFRYYF